MKKRTTVEHRVSFTHDEIEALIKNAAVQTEATPQDNVNVDFEYDWDDNGMPISISAEVIMTRVIEDNG